MRTRAFLSLMAVLLATAAASSPNGTAPTYCMNAGPSSTQGPTFGPLNFLGISTTALCTWQVRDLTTSQKAVVRANTSTSTYSMTWTIEKCQDSHPQANFWAKAWIDWNGKGWTGTDLYENEQVTASEGQQWPATVKASIKVPTNVPAGDVRMRFMIAEGLTYATSYPCASFVYGAAMDVTLTVRNAASYCKATSSVTYATGPGFSKVTLTGESSSISYSSSYCPAYGYSDQSGSRAELKRGSTYSIGVSILKCSSSTVDSWTKGWIDWYGNGWSTTTTSFSDQLVVAQQGQGTYSINNTFTVPKNAEVGVQRFRLYAAKTDAPASMTPCPDSAYDGAVIDFSITVI